MTTTWRTREELVHQVITLAKNKTPKRAIGRALGVSRNTVKSILTAHGLARDAPSGSPDLAPARKSAPRKQKLDAWHSRITELLARYPDITVQRVLETLRDDGYDGGYTILKRRVRELRPPPKPAPSLVTPDYGPGEMAESDWSPYEIRFTRTGKQIVQAFSYVLPFSRRKHIALYSQCDLFALMAGHEETCTRFKGLASACKYDSQKPVVLRWEGHQPIYNPGMLAFTAHYEFRPIAVRRGHPNDKPRVERGFWEVERSFLNGRCFADLADMRAQLVHWLDTIVDVRRRNGQTALDRFAVERDHLVPPPRHPYDTARVVYRVCSIDGFVCYEGNRYAVPYDHVTDILPVRVTQSELFVYAADLKCVARHELHRKGAGLSLDPAGFHPPPGQRQSPIDLGQIAVAFARMGECSAGFFKLLSARPPRQWGREARQILQLRERFDTADLDAALGHAAHFGAVDFAAVERIVSARSRPRTLDEYVAEETVRKLETALGQMPARTRDLTDYDRIPGHPKDDECRENNAPSPPSQSRMPTPPSDDSDDTSTSSD